MPYIACAVLLLVLDYCCLIAGSKEPPSPPNKKDFPSR